VNTTVLSGDLTAAIDGLIGGISVLAREGITTGRSRT
jgi:hypothetical protein